jgi:hypothetical protein
VFTSQLRAPTFGRPVTLAGSLALAAMLVVPSVAAAAPATSASLSGNTLTAAVTDANPRVGMWRIRLVAPGARQRIDFVIRANDINWSGTVRVSERVGERWTLKSKRELNGTANRLEQASGRGAGVRWDTSRFRLPADGNGRFAISVELTRAGSYKFVGFVRTAREAFQYGPWTRTESRVIER